MKRPFTNLFTAPDVQDIMRDRRATLRNVMFMLGSGIVFVCTLLGGYTIGTWFLMSTSDMTGPSESIQPLGVEEGAFPEPPSLEERQAAFKEAVMTTTSPQQRVEGVGYIQAVGETPSLEDRQRALDSMRGQY
jgi:hypothetical protein